MASFRKRGNKYQARVNYYDNLSQRRKPITKTFNTKAEAKKWAAKVEADTNTYVLLNNEVSLAAWIDKYLEIYRKDKIASSTYQNELFTKKRILQYFDKVLIKDITPIMYQQFLNWLKEKDYARSTANQSRLLLTNVLKKAYLQGAIKTNPCIDFSLPYYKPPKKIQWLEASEVPLFLQYMKKRNVYQYYVCYTAIELGCRVGEALALKITDFDLNKQTVHIDKSYNQKTDTFGSTKNKEERTVDFSNQYKKAILNLLSLHNNNKLISGELYKNKYNCIHVDQYGKVVSLSSLYNSLTYIGQKYFNKNLSMHKLRHTHASLLLEAGAEMKYIQHRLGHSSDRITTEVYAHMTDKMRDREKEKYQKYFDKIFYQKGGQ